MLLAYLAKRPSFPVTSFQFSLSEALARGLVQVTVLISPYWGGEVGNLEGIYSYQTQYPAIVRS